MTEFFTLSRTQIEEGIRLCIEKVTDLLDDVELLCENDGNEATAVAIYTIAIEEYGKSLLLNKCLQSKPDNDGNFGVSKTIFGVRSIRRHGHNEKFDEAISDLPQECLDYQKIDVMQGNDNLPSKHREFAEKLAKDTLEIQKKMPNVSIGANYVIPFDFEIRKNLLYVDWDDKSKRWCSTLEIEQYRYEKIPEFGFEYDSKSEFYIKREGNWVTMTSYPYKEKEVELSEEEIYPRMLLNAIESFREHIKN
ncbi:MAG: hypothetical protein KGI19_10215 [Thaumarchaeota archaeon]|nr:hypothetical protein [Nitrososphaerota archaeon]